MENWPVSKASSGTVVQMQCARSWLTERWASKTLQDDALGMHMSRRQAKMPVSKICLGTSSLQPHVSGSTRGRARMCLPRKRAWATNQFLFELAAPAIAVENVIHVGMKR